MDGKNISVYFKGIKLKGFKVEPFSEKDIGLDRKEKDYLFHCPNCNTKVNFTLIGEDTQGEIEELTCKICNKFYKGKELEKNLKLLYSGLSKDRNPSCWEWEDDEMKSARVIITFDCDKNCSYCVNNYKSVIDQAVEKDNLDFVKDYGEIIITGGEPMLYPQETLDLIKEIKKINPDIKIYLYTAKWHPLLQTILHHVDGLTYSLHKNASMSDAFGFNTFQRHVEYMHSDNENKSFRVFIHKDIKESFTLIPKVWDRIKIEGTQEEGECEYLEDDLIILKEGVLSGRKF
jgi:organic radical activating enzyme